ncbi:hypothetical protein [Methylobacterium sp. CCH5-D2]|uniref:hypothetical protein n=1 Tax=Methylobacterium sp. CCH5-D2 TaxID=1768765 RepID=UPI000831A67E|nr:hypothetical protein [Methylobacterium sp. CCH5-D2]
MGSKVVYSVQYFNKDKAGNHVQCRQSPCKTPEQALELAREVGRSRTAVGAVALKALNDDDIGMAEEPIVIGVFGDVPQALLDHLPF